MKRRLYLDNIRTAAVLLVVVYHVFYLFNAAGVPGGFPPFAERQPQDVLLPFVYPWFMALLFAAAGMAARYSLETRTAGEFLKSRTVKLLVPSTLGLFVFQWITGWFNVTLSGGWELMENVPGFVRCLIAVVSGIGPLWFAQTLWLYSLLLLPVRRLDRSGRFYVLCGKANIPVLLALVLPVWAGAQMLNVPVISVYRFGIYGVTFFIGYFVLSHDEVQESLRARRIPLGVSALLTGIVYAVLHFEKNYTSDEVLKSPFTAVYLWLAVLAVFACAGAWWDRAGKVMTALTKVSFGVYILHYPVLLAMFSLMRTVLSLPAAAVYAAGLILTIPLSVGLYELISRIPFLRFAVLGIRKKSGKRKNG